MSGSGNWRWQVRDDASIYLVGEDGQLISPSAIDVLDAEFDGVNSVAGVRVGRPSKDLVNVSFEPSLVSLELVFEPSEEGLVLALQSGSATSFRLASWPITDHFVEANTWWSIDLLPLTVLRAELLEQGITLGVALSTKQVLWLVWNDHVEIDASSLAALGSAGGAHDYASEFDPTLLRATLYPYQMSGATYLSAMVEQGLGALLADEMGLGKTMQALYVLSVRARAGCSPSLVVVPASTLANWERELSRFAPSLSVFVHNGARRTGNPRSLEAFDVVLSTYETVTRDQGLFQMIHWATVVLDEAQAIKNRSTRRSAAIKSLQAHGAVAITGTPIENSLRDMWSIFEFLAPDHLGSMTEFENRFPDTEVAAEQLSRRVAPLVIRRSVSAVAKDLPERIDIVNPIYASVELAEEYDSLRSSDTSMPLARLTKLRQLCAGSAASDPATALANSSKFERLCEIVDGLTRDGSKALVFSSFLDSIDQIAAGLRARFPQMYIATADGRNTPTERQTIIDELGRTEGCGVLVLNPRAAGVGLNIQAANYVVHFTPEWNPATVAQASARAHRRGQLKPVFVYYLYYVGTVEDVMMNRLEAKQRLQDAGLSSVSDGPSLTELRDALAISPNAAGGHID